MGVKVEAEQVAKVDVEPCLNYQPCEISAVVQFPSVCGSNFHPTYDRHLSVRLGFFMYESARWCWRISLI